VTSIFPTLTLDHDACAWEDHLADLTPWEEHQGVWLKREDYFAPLGYGGPNGSKLRQLIWFVDRFREGKKVIVTGASVQSPQLSMSALVGRHYGLDSLQVVYSKPTTILSHPNPRIAAGFGAQFAYASGPYNPILQRRVKELESPDSLTVEYGISLPLDRYSDEDLRDFHEVGAAQVANLPEEVERLVVPAGSCNTLTSIVLGLSWNSKNLKELFTVGIGPGKEAWFRERMDRLGVDLSALPFRWRHHSLHDDGVAYTDKVRGESWDGVAFHSVYEAKVWRYLRQRGAFGEDMTMGLWIVGSEAHPKVAEPFYTRRTGT
jgi:hypothetical protein